MARISAIHQEFVQGVSQKRIRQTVAITDAVFQKYQLYMVELLKPIGQRDPKLIAEAEEFMPIITKELHNLRVEERTDFGQVQSRVGHLHHHTGQVGVTVKHTHNVSFQRYVEDLGREIDITANDERDALVKGTRQLLAKNPALIEAMQEEDKQEAAAILAANPKRANR